VSGIRLSAVVVTDCYATIEPLVRALAAQPGPERIELIAVGPRSAPLDPGGEAAPLGRFRTVEVDSLVDLREARAAGFRAAAAPVVLLAETHCFPADGWLDAVLAAHEEGWAVVGPSFENANPATALSWANFLDHYVRFAAPGRRGPVPEVAGHNSTFLRTPLLALEAELPALLRDFPTLHARLRERGGILFEPAARMRHVHMSTWRGWIAEAWAGGRVNGASRSRAWPLPRRLAYAAATPLIVVLELARRLRWSRGLRRRMQLPAPTVAMLAVGIALRCGGEATGFLLGSSRRSEALLSRTEINRLRYVRGAERRRLLAPARTESRQPETAAAAGSQE
jgi:hypothetical protein